MQGRRLGHSTCEMISFDVCSHVGPMYYYSGIRAMDFPNFLHLFKFDSV